MAETNGTRRLDRIEDTLERVAGRLERLSALQERDHEEFKQDHKQLMTWQVLMQEKMDRMTATQQAEQQRLNALSEKTDQRIAELVSAIGELIRNRPPDAKTV
ncbi:MAG TPA: hypothetical protein VFB14_06705 [Bryobacteraceae bacterium]|jgi:predicted  nucleic acid-binding Zn-ribbon protein|nr:hypothetical protein [Bryobacteraceae bacterium]